MKVVVCDYEFPNLEPEKKALSVLENLVFVPSQSRTEREVIELTRDADGVLNQWNHINANVIAGMSNCKVIATYGIGVDKIDVEAATRKGIYVCNVPDYNKHEVSDHALAMLLAVGRQLLPFDRLIRQGKYGFMHLDNKLWRFEGQTVGLVGFGKIPRKLAYKLQTALGMKVLAYDPYLSEESAKEAEVAKVDLPELMRESDYVSIHVPLTKETRYMIDESLLRMMKPTAYLINCGRGAIVEETALVKVLSERTIAGAAIDVFETEPISANDPLLKLDNVMVTPHAAWHTQESMYDMQWGAANQIALVLSGKEPTNAVNYHAVNKVLGKETEQEAEA